MSVEDDVHDEKRSKWSGRLKVPSFRKKKDTTGDDIMPHEGETNTKPGRLDSTLNDLPDADLPTSKTVRDIISSPTTDSTAPTTTRRSSFSTPKQLPNSYTTKDMESRMTSTSALNTSSSSPLTIKPPSDTPTSSTITTPTTQTSESPQRWGALSGSPAPSTPDHKTHTDTNTDTGTTYFPEPTLSPLVLTHLLAVPSSKTLSPAAAPPLTPQRSNAFGRGVGAGLLDYLDSSSEHANQGTSPEEQPMARIAASSLGRTAPLSHTGRNKGRQATHSLT